MIYSRGYSRYRLHPAKRRAPLTDHPLQERIICLNGEVNETVSASIVAQLLFLEADNPEKPIRLYINTPGGSVTAGETSIKSKYKASH